MSDKLFAEVSNKEFGLELSKVIKGRVVKSFAFNEERMDSFIIITFTDGSILKIHYDWIYDITVTQE